MTFLATVLLGGAFAAGLAAAPDAPHGTDAPRHGALLAVVNKPAATLSLIDLGPGRIVATIPTGSGPHEVATSRNGRWAVVTDYGTQVPGSTLTVVDLERREVVRTIALAQNPRPHGITFLPDDRTVAVSSESSQSVVLVDVVEGVVRRAAPTGQAQSHMVVVSPDGKRGYTANIGPGTLSAVALDGSGTPRTLKVGTMTEALAITPDGRQAWLGSNNTGKVYMVDLERWVVMDSVQTNGFPYRIAFTPDGATALVTNPEAGEIQVIDVPTRSRTTTIPARGGPLGIAIAPGSITAWVTLAETGSVMEIDLRVNAVRRTFAAGPGPDGIAIAGLASDDSHHAEASVRSPGDSAAIRQAALDYVEGFYAGDTIRLKRAIHPDFYKYGFSRQSAARPYRGSRMTWQGMLDYAASVRRGGRPTPATAPRDVELLDVLDQTAAVKLTASWGTDYMLLAKFGDAWQITHVLWQTPPR